MRIFFYGIGQYYQKRRETLQHLRQDDTFLGFLDRRAEDVPVFDGEPVYLPEVVREKTFDAVIITSGLFGEMKEVLCSYGVPACKILSCEAYLAQKNKDNIREYGTFGDCEGQKLLFATPDLGYHGGAMAIIYAAIAMRQAGYRITLAAAKADDRLIRELAAYPLRVLVFPVLQYASIEQLYWIRAYDVVVANVFPMVRFAIRASQLRPTLWWLHECLEAYWPVMEEFPETETVKAYSKLRIATVSECAEENFERYYPDRVDVVLPYCLPDEGNMFHEQAHEKTIFALIGGLIPRKGQDVFLQAVQQLPENLRERAAFWLIGDDEIRDDFANNVRLMAEKEPSVRLCGVMNREDLRQAFRKIDAVVCASREETMSLAITEGMMYGKICITTNKTGIADFLRNGEDGFIVSAEDPSALAHCMQNILEKPESFAAMKQKARETYQAYFTMSRFATRMRDELQNTKEVWKR